MDDEGKDESFWKKYKHFASTEIIMYLIMVIGIGVGIIIILLNT
ncbi:hypothetical protein ACVWYG_000321 [Pedobacter sp. UYEF25]